MLASSNDSSNDELNHTILSVRSLMPSLFGSYQQKQSPSPTRPSTMALMVVWTVAVAAMAGGVITLVGWFTDRPRLTDWFGDNISMFVNPALCSLIAGLCLALHMGRWSTQLATVCRGLAVLVGAIGFLTLSEHLTNGSLGIDTALISKSWGQNAAAAPMRMGVPASLSFVFIGIALCQMTYSTYWRHVASALAMIAIAICSVSIIGYWFGANPLFKIARITGIARQTSLIITLLSIGIIAAIPETGIHASLFRQDAGGTVLRRLILPTVMIPMFLGWLRLVCEHSGVFDEAFGTALQTIAEVGLFGLLLLWTSNSISRNANAFQDMKNQLASIVESSEDAIMSMEPDGKIVSWNPGASRLFGYSPSEVLGKNIRSLIPENRVTEELTILKRILNGVRVDPFETERVHRDGHRISVSLTASPIRDASGEIIGYAKIARDIRETKRVEQALVEAHSRLESILATGEVGTWEFDITENIVLADRNLANMFGLAADGLHGRPRQEFLRSIHESDRERISEAVEQAIRVGGRFEAEFRILDKNKVVRWVVARGRVERDGEGIPYRMPGVLVDVTHRKEIEERIAFIAAESDRQKRLFETVLSNSADMNYSFDLEGRFTFVNKALLTLWKLNASQVIGKTYAELGYPEDLAKRLKSQIQDVIDTRQSIRDEMRYTSGQGEGYYEYIFVPILSADGNVEAVAGSTRDITERKRSENLILLANRNKDEFIATLAHELRNPLSPIASAITLIQASTTSSSEDKQLADMADRHIQQLVRLVDDLLDVSRISRGKVVLQKSVCSISQVVEQALESVQQLIQESSHKLNVHVTETPIFVLGDPARLTQIFVNILNNAAKYTPDGGVISLSVTAKQKTMVFQVTDNGVGIPEEGLAKVFELFTQLESRDVTGKGGLGVGLALVSQLVELHEGRILISSEGENRGTQVVVELPMCDAPPKAPALHQPSQKSDGSLRQCARRQVLVVDDLRANTFTLSRILEKMGHDVQTANSGEAALQMLQSSLPDVAISDVSMPGMSGYELATEIRRKYGQEIQLVAMTGYGTQADRDRSASSGFNFHMVKPPDARVLHQFFASLDG